MKKKALVSSHPLPHVTHSMSTRRVSNWPNAKGQIREKPYLMTTDIGASVMIAWPDITAGIPERELTCHMFCRWWKRKPILSQSRHW
jgi:hypothetical protein